MCATKPSMSWPHSPSRTSSSAWALLGIRSSPRHGLSPVSSSGLLACVGDRDRPGVRHRHRHRAHADHAGDPEALDDLADGAGERLPAVVGLRAVQQEVRRPAAVVEQPDDQPRGVVGLVVVADERHRRPPGPVVVELVDLERGHHRPPAPSRSTRCRAARAAALPASRNPSRTSTSVRAVPPPRARGPRRRCGRAGIPGTRGTSFPGRDRPGAGQWGNAVGRAGAAPDPPTIFPRGPG